jgi:hypothetical protein
MAGTRLQDGRTERSQKGFRRKTGEDGREGSHVQCGLNVEDDVRKMGIKRWRLRTADRRNWRGICEAARVLQEV